MTQKSNSHSRIEILDAVRGAAIWSMIAYHLVFDAAFFQLISFDVSNFWWRLAGWIVGGTFLVLVGMSLWLQWLKLDLSDQSDVFDKKILKKGFQIGGWALVISVLTWFAVPTAFIQFGILHLIAMALMLTWPLVKLKPTFLFGLASILVVVWVWLQLSGRLVIDCTQCGALPGPVNWLFLAVGFHSQAFQTLDYYPLLPWLGLVIAGVGLGQLLYPAWPKKTKSYPLFLVLSGQHSLALYLLHQPIMLLFGGMVVLLARLFL